MHRVTISMNDKPVNPFEYSKDPELAQIFNSMVGLQKKVADQFAKAEKIAGFGADPKFKPMILAKIELPNYQALRNPSDGGWSNKAVDIKIIDTRVQAAIITARAHLEEVTEINKPISEHNQKIREQVTEMMVRLGIPGAYTTSDYPTLRSRTKKVTSHTAGYLQDLNRAIPVSNVSSQTATLNSYIREFEVWKKNISDKEFKESIERDEETVKTRILGNPDLVATLMQAGVNILAEVQKAVPGKKGDVIQYCIVTAMKNVNEAVSPDEDLLLRLKKIHYDF